MRRLVLFLLLAAALTACGQGSAATTSGQSAAASASDSGGVAPAGGDIPDNQVYLAYSAATFTVQYPEGWVQSVRSDGVTFQDRDNRIAVTIVAGTVTADNVRVRVHAIAGASITTDAHQIDLPGGPAVLATYQVDGPADPVTGKRPRLTVDHYELGHAGSAAIIELAGRVGVDNVDAYRMIAQSFRWR